MGEVNKKKSTIEVIVDALPTIVSVSPIPKPSEWLMYRDIPTPIPAGPIARSPSKTNPTTKAVISKKIKPNPSEDLAALKKKNELNVPKADFTDDDADETFSEEKRLYNNINTEFGIRVTDLFSIPSGANPIPYIFEINDMVKEVDASDEDQKKPPEKNPKKVVSKVIKDTIKPSKEIMWQSTDRDEFGSIDSAERAKTEM